jgi:hypothetical protein
MTALDFAMEPPFECTDDDAGDVGFIRATCSIGGWNIIKEYMACVLFPLSTDFGFGEIEEREMPVSRISLLFARVPYCQTSRGDRWHFLSEGRSGYRNCCG